jgi:hypothetical protein
MIFINFEGSGRPSRRAVFYILNRAAASLWKDMQISQESGRFSIKMIFINFEGSGRPSRRAVFYIF